MTGQGGTHPANGTDTQATFRTVHYNVEGCEGVRLHYGNYNQTSGTGGEAAVGNDYTLGPIYYEYGGVPWPVLFGGQATVVVKDGSSVVSDPLWHHFPAGTTLYIRQHVSVASSGMVWPTSGNWASTEGVAANTDISNGTGFSGFVTSGFSFGPTAITGYIPDQTKPVVWIDMDSIGNNGQDPINDYGLGRRALNNNSGSIVVSEFNYGIGARAGQTIAGTGGLVHRHRLRLSLCADLVLSNLSVNSIASSLATMKADALAHWQQWAYTGIPIIACTILPSTSSPDSGGFDTAWATAAAQVPTANESNRTGYNDWLRDTGPTGAAVQAEALGIILLPCDITVNVEVDASNVLTLNGGRWRVIGDGATYNCANTSTTTSIALSGVTLTTNQHRYYSAKVLYASGAQAGQTRYCSLNGTGTASLTVSTTSPNSALPQAPTTGDTVTIVRTTVSGNDGNGLHPNAEGLALAAATIYNSGLLVFYSP
jgi:hypothetical protein